MSENVLTKILIVDDDMYLRDIIFSSLRKNGYEVYQAISGNEALAFLQQTKVDIILSDIQMPAGSGIELLETLRKTHPNLPVVVLMTGQSSINEETALKKGAFKFLAKPFSIAVLLQSLKEASALT